MEPVERRDSCGFDQFEFSVCVNLSQNHFEGIIPTGKQFNTFENNYYGGNPMLCGFPLSTSCNEDKGRPPHSTFHHEESGFGWKAVAVGYACGLVFGMLLKKDIYRVTNAILRAMIKSGLLI